MPTIAACHAAISAGLQRAHVWSPLVVLPRLSSHSNLDKASLRLLYSLAMRVINKTESWCHVNTENLMRVATTMYFNVNHIRILTRSYQQTYILAALHTKTRRRMARERRGAGSSLVSMGDTILETIY